MERGTKFTGTLKQLPNQLLVGGSIPNAIYQIDLTPKTDIPEAQFIGITNKLITEIPKTVKGCTVKYVEVTPRKISLQVAGTFTFAALLLALPSILLLFGVSVAFIVVFLMVSTVPSWLYALLTISVIAIYIARKPR